MRDMCCWIPVSWLFRRVSDDAINNSIGVGKCGRYFLAKNVRVPGFCKSWLFVFVSQDLERTAERGRNEAIRPGCSAAFSVPGDEGGELLVLTAELREEQVTLKRTLRGTLPAVCALKAHAMPPLRAVALAVCGLKAHATPPLRAVAHPGRPFLVHIFCVLDPRHVVFS